MWLSAVPDGATAGVPMADRRVRDGMSGMRRGSRVNVSGNTVEFVAAGIVSASTMTAREAEEGHCGHASGAKNDAEYVEVHLSTHGSLRVFTSAKC